MGTGFLSIVPWHMLFAIINLLIVYKVMKHFFFDKVNRVIQERQEDADELLIHAEQAKEEAQHILQDSKEQRQKLYAESEMIIASLKEKAEKEYNQTLALAKEESKQIKFTAEQGIQSEYQAMLLQAQDDIANMSIEIASKILSREISIQEHKMLIESALKQLDQQL